MTKCNKHKGNRIREWFEDSWWIAFALIASILISLILVVGQKNFIKTHRYSDYSYAHLNNSMNIFDTTMTGKPLIQ